MVCPPKKQVSGSPPGSYTKKYGMRSNPNLSFHFQPRGDVGARTNTKLGDYTDLYLVPEIGDGSPPHHGGQGDLPNLQGKTQGHLSQNPQNAKCFSIVNSNIVSEMNSIAIADFLTKHYILRKRSSIHIYLGILPGPLYFQIFALTV